MNQNLQIKYCAWLRNPAPPKGWLKAYHLVMTNIAMENHNFE